MKMCPAISMCHSDLIMQSRVSKEPIIVAYTAFSKRQVSSFMSFYSTLPQRTRMAPTWKTIIPIHFAEIFLVEIIYNMTEANL